MVSPDLMNITLNTTNITIISKNEQHKFRLYVIFPLVNGILHLCIAENITRDWNILNWSLFSRVCSLMLPLLSAFVSIQLEMKVHFFPSGYLL